MENPRYEGYADLKNWCPNEFGVFNNDDAAFYKAEIGVAASPEKSQNLLELGFGNGSLLGWAKAFGYNCIGYEIQQSLVNTAAARGFNAISSIDDLPANHFDKIVAIDVFEHISFADLGNMLLTLQTSLKLNGRLIARFPNGDSPFSMPIYNGDSTHINSLGQWKVEELLQKSGLKLLELRAPYEDAIGIGGKLKRTFKNALRGMYTRFVRAAFLGGSCPPTFCSNYMLIAEKR